MQFVYIFRNEKWMVNCDGVPEIISISEFYIITLLRMDTELCRSLLLSHVWKQNMSNRGLEKAVF